MDRSIPMLLIGLIFGGGIGFTLAAANNVTLDGHDHADPAAHGAAIPAEAAAHSGHHAMPLDLPQGADTPTLALEVHPDPSAGWNLHLMTTGFRFAPDHASGDHVPGEGHAHLYVNGVKIGRLYGNWVHLPALPAGTHLIEVELNSNDHRPLHVAGTALREAVTLNVE